MTTTQRGYGVEHQAKRQQWKPSVDAGVTVCSRCSEPIQPGEPWHLDHTDMRDGYLGPSHERCNTSAAGKAAHA